MASFHISAAGGNKPSSTSRPKSSKQLNYFYCPWILQPKVQRMNFRGANPVKTPTSQQQSSGDSIISNSTMQGGCPSSALQMAPPRASSVAGVRPGEHAAVVRLSTQFSALA
jgi:hypothetical protein